VVGKMRADYFSFIGFGKSPQLYLTINICSIATATGQERKVS